MVVRALAAVFALALLACGDDGGDGGDGGELINGCPPHRDPLAQPGDPIDGDTYDTFALPLFTNYCLRCHSTTLSGAARNGAPLGYDWDDPASVRTHRGEMRNAVGVMNFMPPSAPRPTCDERARLVRWIDADSP